MMGKHLLLLLGLALLSGFLQALTCIHCNRTSVDGICQTRKSSCQTYGSQQCYLRKVYEDGIFQYARQGCSDLCFPMIPMNERTRVEFICCDNEPFCNRL
ncbi:protein PIP-1-like isoform X2 [Cavia porcellus]|nr:secreted seminal-vesicle Ly-6 protein 1-like [Cavia porcellus]